MREFDRVIDSLDGKRAIDALRHSDVDLLPELKKETEKKPVSLQLGKYTSRKLNKYQLVEVVTKYEDNTYGYRFYLLEVKTNEYVSSKQLYPLEHDSVQVFVEPFVHEMELQIDEDTNKLIGALFTVISYDDVLELPPEEASDMQESEDGNYEDVESRTFRITIDLGD